MARDIQLKERWDYLVEKLSGKFSDGDPLELDAIIYLGYCFLFCRKRVYRLD